MLDISDSLAANRACLPGEAGTDRESSEALAGYGVQYTPCTPASSAYGVPHVRFVLCMSPRRHALPGVATDVDNGSESVLVVGSGPRGLYSVLTVCICFVGRDGCRLVGCQVSKAPTWGVFIFASSSGPFRSACAEYRSLIVPHSVYNVLCLDRSQMLRQQLR
jgi:hypothetical protein